VDVEFIASVSVITPDPARSAELYLGALGLALQPDDTGEYLHSEELAGTRHFGVWPLGQAATACFGTPTWPADRPVPQASVEYEVSGPAAVDEAEQELRDAGFDVLHPARTEPWGQTVVRLQSSEGIVVGVCFTPWMHD
jgi:catechol 2,3-dioxygenase-like lactoylglutathione lyase family enzyme